MKKKVTHLETKLRSNMWVAFVCATDVQRFVQCVCCSASVPLKCTVAVPLCWRMKAKVHICNGILSLYIVSHFQGTSKHCLFACCII